MEIYPPLPVDSNYTFIHFEESLKLAVRHAAHCCIYSPNPFPTIYSLESKAYTSMQMRFDGSIGFPGGLIRRPSLDIVGGLNRELEEEMNLNKKYFVTQEDYLHTYFCSNQKYCYHFFAKAVSVEEFLEIEKNALNAEDYGKEVLGVIRAPLFIMGDQKSGFPTFLSNNFIGCAKHQLLSFLSHTELMSKDMINICIQNSGGDVL